MIVQHHALFDSPFARGLFVALEHSQFSLVMTDASPEQHFLYVNEAFKRQTQYSEDELPARALASCKAMRQI